MILNIKSFVVSMALSVALSAGVSYHYTEKFQRNKYETQISRIHEKHANIEVERTLQLSRETERVLIAERELQSIRDSIDEKQAARQSEIDDAEKVIARLLSERDLRMRDPGTRSNGNCVATNPSTESPGVGDGGAGSELSVEASSFLWSEATRADRIATQLQGCQAYSRSLEEFVNKLTGPTLTSESDRAKIQ